MPTDQSTERPTAAIVFSLIPAVLCGAFLLLTSTTQLVQDVWIYDTKRFGEFGLLFVIFLVPLLNRALRKEFGDSLVMAPFWVKVALLGMLCWGVMSVLVHAQTLMQALNSLSEVALFFALVLAVFILAACRRIAGRLFDRVAIGGIALTGLAVGIQELIGVMAAHDAGVDFNFRISLMYFSWPRFYNQFQSWTVPVLGALPLLFMRHRLSYLLAFLTLGLQWYIILMTGARGSFVSLVAAVTFALVFLPAARSRLLTWQLLGLALGAALFAVVMFSFESSGAGNEPATVTSSHQHAEEALNPESSRRKPDDPNSFYRQGLGKPMAHTSGRTAMWRETLEDIRAHPFTGIGPMNYVCTSPRHIGHPHNFPLQLAAEWGIPVAGLACLLFAWLLWRGCLQVRTGSFDSRENSIFAGLLLTGVLAAALHACLSGVLVMPASQVTGLLICGTLLGLFPRGREKEQRRFRPVWLWSGLLICIFLLSLGAHELSSMQARSALLNSSDSLWPRMWQDSRVCTLYDQQMDVKN